MPILVGWDDKESSIILWNYTQEWTWQESVEAAEQTQILRQSVNKRSIVVILNMEFVQTIPRDSIRNMRRLLHNLQGGDCVILCGSNSAVNVITSFLRTLFQNEADRILMVASLEEARTLAREILSGSPPNG
ncbi:MAG: hypothetical protein KJ065_01055 [Anaerolineae bacterium]|nr:hypothetical protein [Anaerolineae bacterium]